ncbi:putative phage abortive infection protein, partial [Citrobacter braakii]
MRPIIVLALVILMLMTWGVFGVVINLNVNLLGVIATSLAFFATAWAAYEARKSAQAALSAVKTADETLTEAKKNYQRDIFDKRYSLLLEQHNHQLQNVYSYLSSNSSDSKTLSEKVSNRNAVGYAVSYLHGHSILSPYMRTLYHLLKHINENFYIDNVKEDELVKKKKEYSSPLRSIIRNDVLYLIGVNCLVRKRIENNIEVDNGYGYYQDMLNMFNFFEHAIFFDWSDNIQYENVRQKMKDYLDERYTSKIRIAFFKAISDGDVSSNIFINYPPMLPVVVGLGGI